MKDTVLVLEDNLLRIKGFETMVRGIGLRVIWWNNAWMMIRALPSLLPQAALISLDHNLEERIDPFVSPGNGFDVARYLISQTPVCPVILHSGSIEHREAMRQCMHQAGWEARCVPSEDSRRIAVSWLQTALELLKLPPGQKGGRSSSNPQANP